MLFYVYILRSQLDGSFYIGYSNDVERRLAEHNAGLSRYTSKKIPWKIFHAESYSLKSEAIKRERYLKKQKNQDFYLRTDIALQINNKQLIFINFEKIYVIYGQPNLE